MIKSTAQNAAPVRRYVPATAKKSNRRQRRGATAMQAKKEGYRDGCVVPTHGYPQMQGVCKMFYHKAGCLSGNACRFQHVVGRMKPEILMPCKDFQAGVCKTRPHGFCEWGAKCLRDHVQKKDQICGEFNRYGTCSFGDSCKYKHERAKIDQICGAFNRYGTCSFGENCKYKHERTKIDQICGEFKKYGTCSWGENCKFKHEKAVVKKSKKVCNDFKWTGFCNHGENCRFQHVRAMKELKPCGNFLTKDGCEHGDRACRFEHISKRQFCKAYAAGKRCENGNYCRKAHVKLSRNGFVEMWEATEKFLCASKPMWRIHTGSVSSVTSAPTVRSRASTPSVMSRTSIRSSRSSAKTDNSARESVMSHFQAVAKTAKATREAEEAARLLEAERQARLAAQAEAARLAEAARAAERQAELARQEQERNAELARQAEIARRQAELARQEQERNAQLARQAEIARQAELARQEQERNAQLARQAEIARQAELAREFEIARQDAQRNAELARRQKVEQQQRRLQLVTSIRQSLHRVQSARLRENVAVERVIYNGASLSVEALAEMNTSILAHASEAEQRAESMEKKLNGN